jgi:hypothetical protein
MTQYERNYERLTDLLQGQARIRIENDPYPPLVVESICGNQISLWQGKRNSDAKQDPQITFLVNEKEKTAQPVHFRNDYLSEYATAPDLFEGVEVKPRLQGTLDGFVAEWLQEIQDQKYLEAARNAVGLDAPIIVTVKRP